MSAVLNTVAPVFGLIVLGYLAAWLRLLDPAAEKGLASFVFTIAIPALLFQTLASVTLPQGPSVLLLAAFMGAAAVTWGLATLMTRIPLGRAFSDSASISMAATFGNTVMMGIPLTVGYFGDRAIAPLAGVIAVHAPIMWTVASLQNEALSQGGTRARGTVLRELMADLARNPVLIGIVLGTLWRTTGLDIPAIPDKIISYLAAAAIPGALFALGLSLAKHEIRGQMGTLAAITVLKLVVMPAIAWFLAGPVLGLPPLWTGVVVILAACPTGVNAFLFATRYERAVASVSGSIVLGTMLSILTIAALLAILPR